MERWAYVFYSDPGHGWLAVKRKFLKELGILDKITRFSYQRGDTVYLEEDVDVGFFVQAFEARYGKKPTVVSKWTNSHSRIRGYDNFSVQS